MTSSDLEANYFAYCKPFTYSNCADGSTYPLGCMSINQSFNLPNARTIKQVHKNSSRRQDSKAWKHW